MRQKKAQQTKREREIAALVREQQKDRRLDWQLTRSRPVHVKTTRREIEEGGA